MSLKNRSTIDLVVIMLTATVGLTIVFAAMGTILGKVINPQLEVARAAEIIAGTIQTVMGALVGFIGGRATGRMEANGK
jgi:cytochrome c biogenesis protein CcdA